MRRVLLAVAFAVVFVGGIGLGEALNDRPDLSGTQTFIRTLEPETITPLPAETVTVTTSNP